MSSKGSRRGAKPHVAVPATAELSAIEMVPAPAPVDLTAIDLSDLEAPAPVA